MATFHIPENTIIEHYYDGQTGKTDCARCTQWLNAGILSRNLEDVADIKKRICEFKKIKESTISTDNTLGQYLASISNTLGKICRKWEHPPANVTSEEHAKLTGALHSVDKLNEVKQLYINESRRLREGREEARANGESAPREKHHDWEDIKNKEAIHTRDMCEYFLSSEVPMKARTNVKNAIILATNTRMENTRSAWATVKVRNFDVDNDNYISFSEEEYGDNVVVWNVRKGGGAENRKRYNQIIPKDLADILKRYIAVFHEKWYKHQDFLFPFEVSLVHTKDTKFGKKGELKTPQQIMDKRQEAFGLAILAVNKQILGVNIGISDMRRIKITYMGLPTTQAAIERLALKFHHSLTEHMAYFRKAHEKRPAEDDSDAVRQQAGGSTKKSRTENVIVVNEE